MSNNEHILNSISAYDQVIPGNPEAAGKMLLKSKIILGLMLLLMIGFVSFSLAGRSNKEQADLRTEVNNIVDESITDVPEVSLVSAAAFYNENEFNSEINPIVIDLNLTKHSGFAGLNDRHLRDDIINKISGKLEKADLNIYPIINIKFIPRAQ